MTHVSSTFAPPEPSFLSKEAITSFARSVQRSHNFEPGSDLHAFVSALGGSIEYDDCVFLEQKNPGTLFVEGPAEFYIVLPTVTSHTRDNFTIAHEIGHYFVHYLYRNAGQNKIAKMRAQRSGTSRAEWEANWFAAEFLMPESQVRDFISKIDKSANKRQVLESISRYFRVSPKAMLVRLNSLGLEARNEPQQESC